MAEYDLSFVPPALEDLLDASVRLRAFAIQGGVRDGSPLGRRISALADLVERETIRFIGEWLESVRPCDSCEAWCLVRMVVVEGVGLAESRLCPACAGGTRPPPGP
jgi:hypothetical protein